VRDNREVTATRTDWTAWRVVLGFGVVSLTADMVYEGARSMYGPLLASLGATAAVVGLVTGAGEAMALVLRLASGTLADRSGKYWSLTIWGYGLTAVCVPLLAVAPFVGGAGLALATVLILLERSGKAIRSPSKSALLAHAAGAVGRGRGRGFGVHKALDQTGAVLGPLVVAAVVATTSAIWPAMLVLALPGAAAMVLLTIMRRGVPDLTIFDGAVDTTTASASPADDGAASSRRGLAGRWLADAAGNGLPREFFGYAAAAALTTGALVTFGLISFHLTASGLVPVAVVPVVYAVAMGIEALAALATGWLYDRVSSRVLLVVPLLVAAVPALALSQQVGLALAGVAVWAAAYGVQDSTIKALVADLVEPAKLATAYGVFAAIQGAMAVVGGGVAGWLYEVSVPALVAVVALSQVAAFVLLARTVGRVHPLSHLQT